MILIKLIGIAMINKKNQMFPSTNLIFRSWYEATSKDKQLITKTTSSK